MHMESPAVEHNLGFSWVFIITWPEDMHTYISNLHTISQTFNAPQAIYIA